ncbi:MAG: hypothetical protein WA687_09790 [Solirubrobacterales bacterium]
MANIDKPNFDEPREREGFRVRRARIGHQLGTERIGISLWELPPGRRPTRTTSTWPRKRC